MKKLFLCIGFMSLIPFGLLSQNANVFLRAKIESKEYFYKKTETNIISLEVFNNSADSILFSDEFVEIKFFSKIKKNRWKEIIGESNMPIGQRIPPNLLNKEQLSENEKNRKKL